MLSEELSVAKMLYNSYIHSANDYRQQIQDNEQELKVLMLKVESVKASQALIDEKVCANLQSYGITVTCLASAPFE